MKKNRILKASGNFHTKNNILKVRVFIALLLFCDESDNGVKAILLYKISMIFRKIKVPSKRYRFTKYLYVS